MLNVTPKQAERAEEIYDRTIALLSKPQNHLRGSRDHVAMANELLGLHTEGVALSVTITGEKHVELESTMMMDTVRFAIEMHLRVAELMQNG